MNRPRSRGRATLSLLTALTVGASLLSLVPALGGSAGGVSTMGCNASDRCTLEELFLGGNMTVLDKIFSRWEVIKIGFDLGPYNLGNFSSIEVFGIIDDPLRPGIRFVANGGFNASQRFDMDFGFHVATVNGDARIREVEMALVEANFAGPGGRVKIYETIFSTNSTYLADIWVEEDNQFGGGLLNDSAQFPPQSDVFVEKNILIEPALIRNASVLGGPLFVQSTAQLEIFEQRFGQVPPTATPTSTATLTATATATGTATSTATATNTPVPQGGACSMDSNCVGGLVCADTVCCESVCDSPLEVCNLAGQEGTCVSVAAPAPAASRGALLTALAILLLVAGLALQRLRTRGELALADDSDKFRGDSQ